MTQGIVVRTENDRENLQSCAQKMMEEISKVAHGKLTERFPKVHNKNDAGHFLWCTRKVMEGIYNGAHRNF